MPATVVPFSRTLRSRASTPTNGNGRHGPVPLPHVYEWQQVAMLALRDPDDPRLHTAIKLAIRIRPEDRLYEVGVAREGWDYVVVLQDHACPGESEAHALVREGVLRFLNELLAAAYGVPA